MPGIGASGSLSAARIRGVVRTPAGAPVLSTETASGDPDEIGLGPALRRYITTGLYNSDIALTPMGGVSAQVAADRPLPHWTYVQSSGTAIVTTCLPDPTSGSGNVLQMALLAGAAGDAAYIEQIVPLVSSSNRAWSYSPYAFVEILAANADAELTVELQYLRKDLTATGAALSSASAATPATLELGLSGAVNTITPADAYFARVRYGLRRRGGGAAGATATVQFTETYLVIGQPRLHVTEIQAPGTYGIGAIRQTNGGLFVEADSRDIALATGSAFVQLWPRRALSSYGAQLLVAATAILAKGEFVPITAAAPVTITAAPTIADPAVSLDLQVLVLMNTGANAITLQDQGTLANSNLRLSTATFVMGQRDNLTLLWNATIGDWVEIARTNVI
jgi:hypothetical protein